MIPLAPKRRWSRWSLRTLFAVVTLFGILLGYELNWLHQRHQMIAKHQLRMKKWQGLEPEFRDLEEKVAVFSTVPRSGPGLLWIFGERAVISLKLLDSVDEGGGFYCSRDTKASERLFPEAAIFTFIIDPYLK
jgi:hypothetical protein